MSHKDIVITSTGGVNISMLALVLTLVAYLCSVAGVMIGAGYYQGRQTLRIETLEAFKVGQDAVNLRQIAANEEMAKAFNNLALELTRYRTIVDERTTRDISQSRRSEADNRAGIERNRAAIVALPAEKKKTSLATIIGIK